MFNIKRQFSSNPPSQQPVAVVEQSDWEVKAERKYWNLSS